MARADRSKMDPLAVQCIAQTMQDKEADLATINKWLAEVGAKTIADKTEEFERKERSELGTAPVGY